MFNKWSLTLKSNEQAKPKFIAKQNTHIIYLLDRCFPNRKKYTGYGIYLRINFLKTLVTFNFYICASIKAM